MGAQRHRRRSARIVQQLLDGIGELAGHERNFDCAGRERPARPYDDFHGTSTGAPASRKSGCLRC
jgi:hypothetical protein